MSKSPQKWIMCENAYANLSLDRCYVQTWLKYTIPSMKMEMPWQYYLISSFVFSHQLPWFNVKQCDVNNYILDSKVTLFASHSFPFLLLFVSVKECACVCLFWWQWLILIEFYLCIACRKHNLRNDLAKRILSLCLPALRYEIQFIYIATPQKNNLIHFVIVRSHSHRNSIQTTTNKGLHHKLYYFGFFSTISPYHPFIVSKKKYKLFIIFFFSFPFCIINVNFTMPNMVTFIKGGMGNDIRVTYMSKIWKMHKLKRLDTRAEHYLIWQSSLIRLSLVAWPFLMRYFILNFVCSKHVAHHI